MRATPPPDYFAALAAKEKTVELSLLDGSTCLVRRARLLEHIELERIARNQDADEMDRAVDYIAAATGRSIDDFDAGDVLPIFAKLAELNTALPLPAIMRSQGRGRAPNAFQYEGRWLAALVMSLSQRGWTPDYILQELGPEEAWLYFQEAAYDEWLDHDQQYRLSDLGRDKRGKQKKLSPPAWVNMGYPQDKPGKPLPDRLRPQGVVIRLQPTDEDRARYKR